MHELTELLKGATARIAPLYFQVVIDGGDPVYRERVYCYELYHQLRCLWPTDTPFYLNGELDKAAHPILREMGADYAKPDLLVHQPGHMAGNNTIIEVKSANAQNEGIKKDLKTLALFRSKVGYQRAIYLVFGHGVQATTARVRKAWSELQEPPPIELWIHDEAGHAAREIGFQNDA
ncbi:methionyl-tRNA formyltransferase-like protein [Dechloromonas sp. CZR5]|uniref:methionyl-tRNA formyltransferase-like protein n=1 Tax=Dechloromonas sp. CZR5 TaxID=2608630 RepID=UPI00123D87C9|nr:methionyl-tRNA formyltransferase-like protein [Dechloromonas sp. CZR5]